MLSGKTAVITGSTSGIGLGIARALAREHANVIINGLGDPAPIERELAAIEAGFGVKAIYSAADLSRPGEIVEMIRVAENTFGAVDILVNNAGIQHVAPIEEFPVEKWDQILAVNLSAAFHAIRAAVPGMKSRRWGENHQHGIGPFAGGDAVQVGLCGRQARAGGADQIGGAGVGDIGSDC